MAESPEHLGLAEGLRETVRPLDQARTLPGACYTSKPICTLEQRALFGQHWLVVAREADIPDGGCFVTREIAGERVLVVRGHDGRLRAFFNVCRHRGSRLLEEPSGRLRGALIACPYHAWTYELDGRLRQAPRTSIAAPSGTWALVTMPLACKEGFVFVNPDGTAPAFAQDKGLLPDLSRFALPRLERVRSLEYRVQANWKLICENYSECYHCSRAHPQLDRLGELSAGGFESAGGFNGGPMRLRNGVDTLSMSGRSSWPRLANPASGGERLVHYYLVYPNLMLGIHPDYLAVHIVWPLDEACSRVLCEIFVPGETRALPAFDPSEVVDFWDLTNRQDWMLCERVQRGIGSRGYRPGPYAPSERCVHAFDRWYARWLLQSLFAR